jgi:AAA domain
MRLHRLDLLRYGHLTDVMLALPDDARLHVVHSANEAGKSTALAAIADALCGFGHRTDYDFLHGAPQPGLLNLHAVLSRIDEEAKSLVGDGRGRRRLSDAVEAWRSARARAKSEQWRRGPGKRRRLPARTR